MLGFIRVPLFTSTLFTFFVFLSAPQVNAGEQSSSVEIEYNIKKLQESNSCQQCDLHGADLTRMDLSGADLEGANLARAKMFLTNLSGANLKNSDLRGAMFGGADLGNADLSGADLTGATLAGAYMRGTKLDGEMLTTTALKDDDITPYEETVYVEDTVKPKPLQEPEDVTIESSNDLEETAPSEPLKTGQTEMSPGTREEMAEKEVKTVVPEKSKELPDSKTVPVIQKVKVQESEAEPQVLLADDTKKQLSQKGVAQNVDETAEIENTPTHKVVEEVGEKPEETEGTERSQPVDSGEGESITVVQTEVAEEEGIEELAAEQSITEEGEKPVSAPSKADAAEISAQEIQAGEDIGETAEGPEGGESGQSVTPAEGEGVAVVQTEVVEETVIEATTEQPTPEEGNEAVTTPSTIETAESDQPIVPKEGEGVALAQTESVEEKVMVLPQEEAMTEEGLESATMAATNESGEEVAQDVEVSGEALTNSSVTEPDPEVLQNIEELLDTNRCYGCNLSGADLSGANLDGADLEGADLSNALLTKADLEEANLKGANLSGADLSGADLSEADLYKAILTGADMTNTTLEETLLDDAELSGVKGYVGGALIMEGN